MSEKRKYPRADAMAVARELCADLKHKTERLIVAGSLRRGKMEVGDVEILYIPHFIKGRDALSDLFETKEVSVNCVDMTLEVWLSLGVLEKRPKENGSFTWGDQNKLAIHKASGIPVDFFAARPGNWWNLLVCRTGSKESNERLCNAAIARGWKWQPYGAGFECRHTGKQVYTVESEADVFHAVGLVCKEPKDR